MGQGRILIRAAVSELQECSAKGAIRGEFGIEVLPSAVPPAADGTRSCDLYYSCAILVLLWASCK